MVGEHLPLPAKCDELRQYRSIGGSADAQLEGVDKQRVEDCVEDDGENRGVHSLPWLACGAQHCIQTEVQMCDGIAKEDNLHVFSCVGQGIVRSSEEP